MIHRMKRTIINTLLLLGATLCLNAQATRAQEIEWGVRGGANVSKLVGIVDAMPKTALYLGFAEAYLFNESWGIYSDQTISAQGTRCLKDANGVEMEYNYNYLNIPLLGFYQIPLDLNGDKRLRLLAGVQLGVLLNASYDYTHPSVMGEGSVAGGGRFDRQSFHAIEVGVALGAQWFISPNAALELRYTLGITQTHNGISNTLNGYYYISVPDNRNSVVQIGTTFLF